MRKEEPFALAGSTLKVEPLSFARSARTQFRKLFAPFAVAVPSRAATALFEFLWIVVSVTNRPCFRFHILSISAKREVRFEPLALR